MADLNFAIVVLGISIIGSVGYFWVKRESDAFDRKYGKHD